MIQTIQLIKLCYPFIILAVFFCLYKKDNRITRKFCWRMTMTHSARKLFVIAVPELGSPVSSHYDRLPLLKQSGRPCTE